MKKQSDHLTLLKVVRASKRVDTLTKLGKVLGYTRQWVDQFLFSKGIGIRKVVRFEFYRINGNKLEIKEVK